jgi:diguanylate cyclase (GGDEF)-like protein
MKRRIIRLMPLLVAVAAPIGVLAAVLWQRSPVLAVALAGPAAALLLYERSIRRGRAAMRLALTDPLTGLGNQRAFHERLARDLERVDAAQAPIALCLLDVDGFKRINDERGHPAGDRLLAEVARCLRRDGEAFRLGGDEFALVLPGSGTPDAAVVAQAVVARIPALAANDADRVTVSAGLAWFPDDAETPRQLVDCADARLYRAKAHGGNRVAGREETLEATGNDR